MRFVCTVGLQKYTALVPENGPHSGPRCGTSSLHRSGVNFQSMDGRDRPSTGLPVQDSVGIMASPVDPHLSPNRNLSSSTVKSWKSRCWLPLRGGSSVDPIWQCLNGLVGKTAPRVPLRSNGAVHSMISSWRGCNESFM